MGFKVVKMFISKCKPQFVLLICLLVSSDLSNLIYSPPLRPIHGQTPSQPPVQLVMATATLTKAVKALLSDVDNGGFDINYK